MADDKNELNLKPAGVRAHPRLGFFVVPTRKLPDVSNHNPMLLRQLADADAYDSVDLRLTDMVQLWVGRMHPDWEVSMEPPEEAC